MYGKWDPQKKITRDQMNELRQLRKEVTLNRENCLTLEGSKDLDHSETF